jgi:curved DNA-binding protein CbpA
MNPNNYNYYEDHDTHDVSDTDEMGDVVDIEEDDENNLYHILGLPSPTTMPTTTTGTNHPSSTMKEIRSAYRRKALQYHPDKQSAHATEQERQYAQEQFTKVAAAYEILSNVQQRQKYDNSLLLQQQQQQQQRNRNHHPTTASTHSFADAFHNHNFNFSPFSFHSPFGSSFRPTNSSSTNNDSDNNNFQFHDPFALFEEVFQQQQDEHVRNVHQFHSPAWDHPFGGFGNFNMSPGFGSMPSMFPTTSPIFDNRGNSNSSSTTTTAMHHPPMHQHHPHHMMTMMMDPFQSTSTTSSNFFTSTSSHSSTSSSNQYGNGESITTTSHTINGQTVTERTIRKRDGSVHTERTTSNASTSNSLLPSNHHASHHHHHYPN